MTFVKCADCGSDTDVDVESIHGGIFFCDTCALKHVKLAVGTGSRPVGLVWTRSEYQAKLDEGKSIWHT